MNAQPPLLRKAANAVFQDLDPVVRAVQPVTELYEKLMGGQWVGGWMELTETELTFAPNLLNRMAIRGDSDLTIRIPLEAIRSVEIIGGFVTKIISVRTADGQAKLRCWGAPAVAEQIRGAAGLSAS